MNENNSATYCPEDNKLRLYVGRVPREEYLKLKEEGWTALPKQRELGKGDFAATWTPEREATALTYAEFIEDEDAGPAERAADRAERFAGYREKRVADAEKEADRYEGQPMVHGFQDAAKAERSAARHDRIGDKAVNAWDKAEYWQRRTSDVISHALYQSCPSVRMGRIIEIETQLRRLEGRTDARGLKWIAHLKNRLSYENQMLEAAGGRAGVVEMIPGGWLRVHITLHGGGERRILKVNKSYVTGRVVSVLVRDNYPSSTNHWGNPWPDGVAKTLVHTVEVQRLSPDCYRAPTDEELAEFIAAEKAAKKAQPKVQKAPLINPTDEDAERLQAILNELSRRDMERRYLKAYGSWMKTDFKPSTVLRMTQAEYSLASKGTYASCETKGICRCGVIEPRSSNLWSKERQEEAKRRGPAVCEVRTTGSNGSDYGARRVIVLKDKPQKPIPAAVWETVSEKEEVTA